MTAWASSRLSRGNVNLGDRISVDARPVIDISDHFTSAGTGAGDAAAAGTSGGAMASLTRRWVI